jgi:hypothetical protein
MLRYVFHYFTTGKHIINIHHYFHSLNDSQLASKENSCPLWTPMVHLQRTEESTHPEPVKPSPHPHAISSSHVRLDLPSFTVFRGEGEKKGILALHEKWEYSWKV